MDSASTDVRGLVGLPLAAGDEAARIGARAVMKRSLSIHPAIARYERSCPVCGSESPVVERRAGLGRAALRSGQHGTAP